MSHHLPADSVARLLNQPNDKLGQSWMRIVRHLTGATAVFLMRKRDDETEFQAIGFEGSVQEKDGEKIVGVIRRLARKTDGQASPVWRKFTLGQLRLLSVAAPIDRTSKGKQESLSLAVILPADGGANPEAISAVLQAASVWPFYCDLRERQTRELSVLSRTAAFVELLSITANADDFETSIGLLAEHLRDLTGCDNFALFTRGKRGHTKLVALTGTELDTKSETTLALEASARTAIRQDNEITGFGENRANGPLEMARQKLSARAWHVAPLKDGQGRVTGAWIQMWREVPLDFDERVSFMRAAARQTAPLLGLLRDSKPSGIRATIARVWDRATGTARRLLLTAGCVLAAIAIFPASLRVKAPCEVQPEARRMVAAPFPSLLREALVEPGESVVKGQPIAELDGREVRFQLSEVVAGKNRALKEADLALSAGKVAESQMAALEAEGLAEREKMLQQRSDGLIIRSPIDGIVLKGELERAVGIPVETGDPLFELAPADQIFVELAVPDSEMGQISEDVPVKFKLDAFPGNNFEATLTHIAPRSETADGQNVFFCEARLDYPGELRPGMKGEAKIIGARRPLIYHALRPALDWIRLKLVW